MLWNRLRLRVRAVDHEAEMDKQNCDRGVRVLRMRDLCQKIQSSRSGVYRRLDKNDSMYDASFPRAIKLGSRSIGFLESEVDSWIFSRTRVCK